MQFMPDYSAAYMKAALKAGKQVHLVGFQGSGKSTIRNLFVKYDYAVTAPEDVDYFDNCFSIPTYIHNLVLLEVEHHDLQDIILGSEISKADIENWLNL